MGNKLEKAFHAYVKAVELKLRSIDEGSMGKAPLRVLEGKNVQLRGLVDELENGTEFGKLVVQTRSVCSGYHKGRSKLTWEEAIRNFFRGSEFYCDIFEKRNRNYDNDYNDYCEASEREEMRVRYLAPMEFVRFAKQGMDFESFQIRQLTEGELRSILGERVNRVFYPWAVLDACQLADYWFIDLTEKSAVPKLGVHHLEGLSGLVRVKYSKYPRPLERVLRELVLLDWEPDSFSQESVSGSQRKGGDLRIGWQRFNIPFVLEVNDNLLGCPKAAPETSELEKEPVPDTQTGKVIGERPMVLIYFDEEETESFETVLKHIGRLVGSMVARQKVWHFLDIAVNYLIKAFLSEGLEQLLWHIVALESLLVRRGEPLKETLARRAASIMAETKNEGKRLGKEFKDLYDFRCDLVHGNVPKKEIYVGHLREARELARRMLLWFLHCLDAIESGPLVNLPAENRPTHEDILKLIDMDQGSRARIHKAMDNLPTAFPYVQAWLG